MPFKYIQQKKLIFKYFLKDKGHLIDGWNDGITRGYSPVVTWRNNNLSDT